jgi:hypothetical protein
MKQAIRNFKARKQKEKEEKEEKKSKKEIENISRRLTSNENANSSVEKEGERLDT